MKNISVKTILILISVLFFIWIIFLDDFNIIRQVKLNNVKKELKAKEQYHKEIIHRDSVKAYHLRTNKDSLIKYAREKYLMKEKDEDIFLIIREDEE